MRRGQRVSLAVLVPAVVIGALFIGRAIREEPGTGVQVTSAADVVAFEPDFTIPPGTADLIAAGETVASVPRELAVHVGESIRIVDVDDVGHVVGVFFVAPGETLTQRFVSPGELSEACSVHSGGEFTLRVEA